MNQNHPGVHLPPVRWWWGIVFFFIALAIPNLFFILLIVLSAGTDSPKQMENIFSSPLFIGASIVFISGFLSAAAFFLQKKIKLWADDTVSFHFNRVHPTVMIAALIGIVAVGFVVDEILFFFHSIAPNLFDISTMSDFSGVFRDLSLPGYIGLTLIVSLGPGIGEELFFRGLLLRLFKRELSGPAAVVLCGFLFGVMHMNMLQGMGAGLLGLFLGFLALRAGIWPAIAAHTLNNLLMAFVSRYGSEGDTAWTEGHPLWFVILTSSVSVWAVWIVLKRTSKHHKTSENGS